ncbi:MAG: hypothetical protein PHT48_09345 [Dechloromonas sp.]|nr:hypothetical protein [Dechloromonas sp.]
MSAETLDALQRRLQKHFVGDSGQRFRQQLDASIPTRWRAVEQALLPLRGHRSAERVAQGVVALRLAGSETAYPEIKYACHGLARPMDWDGRLLIDEPGMLDALLAALDRLRYRPRCYAACYRGLLAAWTQDILGNPAMIEHTARLPALQRLLAVLKLMRANVAKMGHGARWGRYIDRLEQLAEQARI